jgi:DMSO/TMAO reductase YedYZ molybdopterin-dependent catalytic subunit
MTSTLSRRAMLKRSAATAALFCAPFPLAALDLDDPDAGTTLPFPEQIPTPNRPMVQWAQLSSWLTPPADFFAVNHYGSAKVEADKWRLEFSGLVRKPLSLSLADLQARRSRETIATLECSGNGASTAFMGAVGNTRWRGVPLAGLLRECGLKPGGIEVVFYGADEKTEKIKDHDYPQHFGRSLSVADAMDDRILLAWEMDGQPLSPEHGFPLRLIVPGWYGIAWVKWLTRIEVLDRRFMGRFMARDYVTIRGEDDHGAVNWRETSVTRLNPKSLVARVLRRPNGSLNLMAAAWTDGTPLKTVELKIDGGSWQPMQLDRRHQAKYAWSFWTYDWKNPAPGEHTVVSRATDIHGNIQPAYEDPAIQLKKTYYEANQQIPRTIKL